MSDIKPSKMRCKKCGYEPNVITDICLKCGGEIVKICGNCGYENSVEKTCCDSCGSLLALTPDKKIDIHDGKSTEHSDKKMRNDSSRKVTLEFESISETVAGKEESYRRSGDKKHTDDDVKERLLDKGEIAEFEKQKIENFAKKKDDKILSENNEVKKVLPLPVAESKNKKKLYIVLSAVIAVVICVTFLLLFKNGFSKYNLTFTAKKYLTAIKDENYVKAYEFLSSNSKSLISLNDYLKTSSEYYSKAGKWDFKDLKIYYFDDVQSIITYKLKEGNGEWKDDYINFIKEHGVWTRPYVWNLFEQIDDAFGKRDFSTALFLSQKLYLIDPLDPRSAGYLCWSEYFMRLYDKSMESCKKVLELSAIHPVKYYSDVELFWNKFNYADSLRFTNRLNEALNVYNLLIADSNVSLEDKCSVFIARADTHLWLKQYDKTEEDLASASSVCKDDMSKREADNRIKIMQGLGCDDAIKLVKNYNYNGTRFEDFMDVQMKNVAEKGRKNKLNLQFSCKYISGPDYLVRVSIYGGHKKDVNLLNYKGEVNLWEKTVEMKEAEEE
jgi:hypothetical protein